MKVKHTKIELSDQQREIVEWVEGPLLVSAGPGSGKTRVVVERIGRLLEKHVKPSSILATTFTRKAANEMNERLEAKRIDTKSMSVQTMHSLCWRIIREHKNFRGWKIDDKETYRLVLKNIIGYKNLNWIGCDITEVENFIASARNNLVAPENSGGFMHNRYRDPRYSEAYMMYSDAMAERKLINFDDMLYYGVRILENDERVLDRMRGQYEFVMVDEFQDSNFAQLTLADLIANPLLNYMAVGDIDQAIYSWRGALPEFMLEFQEKYNAKLVELSVNYRCSPAIMDAAGRCIENNENRFSRELTAHRSNEAVIKFIQATDPDEEALMVKDEIQLLRTDNVSYDGMRVLMRTNSQSRAIEEEFVKSKIPFVVLGSVSFYERKEIKDLLSYLRIMVDPRDALSGERAINRPFRYIGRRQLDSIRDRIGSYGSYVDAAESVLMNGRNERAMQFVQLVRQFDAADDAPADVLRTIVQETDYIHYLMEQEGTDSPETSRALNVGELIASATRFRTIAEFVDHVDMQIKLRKRNQRKKVDSRVQVMTIHKAKGTEANTIFLIGANEGIIPHVKGDIEEERRLFYVAVTRAKDHLYVSTITGEESGATVQCSPSRFTYEAGIVPDDNDDLTDSTPDDIVNESSEGSNNAHTENVQDVPVESIHGRD